MRKKKSTESRGKPEKKNQNSGDFKTPKESTEMSERKKEKTEKWSEKKTRRAA